MCAGCVLVGLLILVSLCGTFNLASGCFLTAPPSYLQERKKLLMLYWGIEGLPGGSDGKGSAYNVGDPGSIPGLGRSPGEGNGNPLQYSCLEKSHGLRSLLGCSPWGHKE